MSSNITKEEKELLLKDLCGRLSYGVKCCCIHEPFATLSRIDVEDQTVYYQSCDEWESIEYCKPYLRPLSSMTEEELFNYKHLDLLNYSNDGFEMPNFHSIDWLISHHFDYRGLIPMGLAFEAPKNMYKTE